MTCRYLSWLLLLLAATTTTTTAEHHIAKDFFGGTDHEEFAAWVDAESDKYEDHQFLPQLSDPTLGMSIHWSIVGDRLQLAIAARAKGWISFGISENGGMEGADVVYMKASNKEELIDGHILDGLAAPVPDECQNWELVAVHASDDEDAEFMIVEMERLLDTGDAQDRVIFPDGSLDSPPALVIAAWGDGEMEYHGGKKARTSLRWYNPELGDREAFDRTMEEEAEGFFQFLSNDHPIKATETEYVDLCFSWDDVLAQGVPDKVFDVVGFEPIVQSVEHVHHYTLFGKEATYNGEPCSAFADHFDLVYGWARGETAAALPLDVGLKIGQGFYRSFRLEIHYDNPELKENVEPDSSGIRFHYTTKPRKYELGLLQLGDPSLFLVNQTLGEGMSEHSFYCPHHCTDSMIEQDQEVTILREYLHMHDRGVGGRNELIRNGEVVHTGSVEFFRFAQQGNQLIRQQPFKVRKGDEWNTVCNFKNSDDGTFGYASDQEMCMVFIMYYPRVGFKLVEDLPWFCDPDPELGFPPCVANYSYTKIDEVPRVFGTSETCAASSGTALVTWSLLLFMVTFVSIVL